MGKWIRRILIVISAAVFCFSAVQLIIIWHTYRASAAVYKGAVEEYVEISTYTPPPAEEAPAPDEQADDGTAVPENKYVFAPIVVDFTYLTATNPDVIGWLYCEDSRINYPVVFGRDNEYYLTHNYLREYDSAGAIFSDKNTVPGFSDYNTVVYGHYKKDMSMLGSLDKWYDQSFYDDHAFMWLLTPEQDYRVEIFSAYTTPADSDSYTVFHDKGPELESYLAKMAAQSYVESSVELDPEAHYILLSTCAYSFYEARTVLHGKLVPVDSAGGVPFFILEMIKGDTDHFE